MEVPTLVPGAVAFAVLTLIGSIITAWLLIFAWRFATAPGRLYATLQDQVRSLEERLTPKFSLTFEDADIRHVPAENDRRRARGGQMAVCPAWWALFSVQNDCDRWISGCTALLFAVSFKEKETDAYIKLLYQGPAPLLTRSHFPENVAPRLALGVNVFSVDQIDQRIKIRWQQELQVNEKLFDKRGFYKLDIQVSTNEPGFQVFEMEIEWRGVFEKPRIKRLPA